MDRLDTMARDRVHLARPPVSEWLESEAGLRAAALACWAIVAVVLLIVAALS